ncbi:MAG: ABC transporter ATP-binding protein [Candidatus Ancillula sp.]|jgi:sulfonate transport system ATP-binding protein|nr:ABC transporter ATP-binding protein [Candidatus Ancillula sp.]
MSVENLADSFVIKFSEVALNYESEVILSDVNLEIKKEDSVSIIGRSGTGKSTLLRSIVGEIKPSVGDISSRGKVSFVFQEPTLVPWLTVAENIKIVQSSKKNLDIDRILFEVGLEGFRNRYPNSLSGGQKSRVGLARALAVKPDILLMDEPFSSLDALTRLEMQNLEKNLQKEHKWTSLIVTHDIEEALTMSKRVIVVKNGTCFELEGNLTEEVLKDELGVK